MIRALAPTAAPQTGSSKQEFTPMNQSTPSAPATPSSRDDLAQGLIRIGEQGIAREDDAAVDAFFAADFILHGPGGDTDLAGLKRFWVAYRAAFSDFTITRGLIVVEGNYVATQTRFSGVFERELTQSPVGPLPPTGQPFVQDLLNIFRFDETGRLAEEWLQYDIRDLLRQWGAEGQ